MIEPQTSGEPGQGGRGADPSDVDLMLRIKRGDEDAFTLLVRRHQNALFTFFRSMGLSHDAEDAVQETFLRLYRYRSRYEPRAAFRTFMYLVARQVCFDAFRKRGRQQRLLREVERETPAQEAKTTPLGDAAARAEELLQALPEAMRIVVVMSIYQGLRYEEIGEALGIPAGTVKSRMFHAMLRLREALHARKTG
jgi:RNA polymerase sigma-70 factor, ECF subfamily